MPWGRKCDMLPPSKVTTRSKVLSRFFAPSKRAVEELPNLSFSCTARSARWTDPPSTSACESRAAVGLYGRCESITRNPPALSDCNETQMGEVSPFNSDVTPLNKFLAALSFLKSKKLSTCNLLQHLRQKREDGERFVTAHPTLSRRTGNITRFDLIKQ